MTRSELVNIRMVLRALVCDTTIALGAASSPTHSINIGYRLAKQQEALMSVKQELDK